MLVIAGNGKRGVTLIELGVALGVIALLSTLFLVAASGYRSKSLEDRAEADLQVIQIGLENYRARFGDYPRVPETYPAAMQFSTPKAFLLNSLCGKIGPAWDVISDTSSFLNTSLLNYEKPGLPGTTTQDNWIVDPWGEPYVYDYDPKDEDWDKFGYILYSKGPDAVAGNSDDIVAK